jgi:hypothetical protein
MQARKLSRVSHYQIQQALTYKMTFDSMITRAWKNGGSLTKEDKEETKIDCGKALKYVLTKERGPDAFSPMAHNFSHFADHYIPAVRHMIGKDPKTTMGEEEAVEYIVNGGGVEMMQDKISELIRALMAVGNAYGPIPSHFTVYRGFLRPKEWLPPRDIPLNNFMSASLSPVVCTKYVTGELHVHKDVSIVLYRIRGPQKGTTAFGVPFFALTRDDEFEMLLLPKKDIVLRMKSFKQFTDKDDIN